jgi:transposase
VIPPIDSLPNDLESLKRLLAMERAARIDAEAKAASAEAAAARAATNVSSAEALIAHLKLAIEKMRRELYGSRSERGRKLLDQMELELEDLETTAAEDESAAEKAAAEAGGESTLIPAPTRCKPTRKPFPDHLPRERVIIPGPANCACCGSMRLAKLGEDITETLEVIPRQWKVIQYVREKFTCRACEKISQAPAPFHVIARGRAGPSLLAMILYAKFALHQPLNRQSEAYAREGVDLPLSTLADDVGACAAVLKPLADLIGAHVFAAARIHGDDTPVPLLAKGKTVQARLWTYVRDDCPFGGPDPPAAVYFFSRDRCGDHPERHLAKYGGILQADAYAGFNALYRDDRALGPLTEAACRVDEEVATLVPHRPGRADYPHPVLHAQASLT